MSRINEDVVADIEIWGGRVETEGSVQVIVPASVEKYEAMCIADAASQLDMHSMGGSEVVIRDGENGDIIIEVDMVLGDDGEDDEED